MHDSKWESTIITDEPCYLVIRQIPCKMSCLLNIGVNISRASIAEQKQKQKKNWKGQGVAEMSTIV